MPIWPSNKWKKLLKNCRLIYVSLPANAAFTIFVPDFLLVCSSLYHICPGQFSVIYFLANESGTLSLVIHYIYQGWFLNHFTSFINKISSKYFFPLMVNSITGPKKSDETTFFRSLIPSSLTLKSVVSFPSNFKNRFLISKSNYYFLFIVTPIHYHTLSRFTLRFLVGKSFICRSTPNLIETG